MALSKQAQAAILASDAQRRKQREAIEDALLTDVSTDRYKIAHAPKDSHVNACLVRGIGVVSPPPKPRASRNSWDRGMNCRTTVGTADPKIKTPTVKITSADGVSRIVTVSEVRGIERKRARKATTTTRKPESARLSTHHDFTTH